jgi:hypothetical protein
MTFVVPADGVTFSWHNGNGTVELLPNTISFLFTPTGVAGSASSFRECSSLRHRPCFYPPPF